MFKSTLTFHEIQTKVVCRKPKYFKPFLQFSSFQLKFDQEVSVIFRSEV